jgi:hypothetical protein
MRRHVMAKKKLKKEYMGWYKEFEYIDDERNYLQPIHRYYNFSSPLIIRLVPAYEETNQRIS